MGRYTEWENTRNGKIHGMGRYTEWEDTRNGKIEGVERKQVLESPKEFWEYDGKKRNQPLESLVTS